PRRSDAPAAGVLPLDVGHAHQRDVGVAVPERRRREPAPCGLQAPLGWRGGAVEAAALAVGEGADFTDADHDSFLLISCCPRTIAVPDDACSAKRPGAK